jgi:hypothetical protein
MGAPRLFLALAFLDCFIACSLRDVRETRVALLFIKLGTKKSDIHVVLFTTAFY